MSESNAMECVKKWLTTLDYNSYEINIENTTSKGDNYSGEIYFMSVIVENRNALQEKLGVVVKIASSHPTVRNLFPLNDFYQRESYFYLEVFPALVKFQKDLNVKNPFTDIPQCLYSSLERGKEVLIFENMKKLGFELLNKSEAMDSNHITFVLKELGRWHGLTFVLKEKNHGIFKKFALKMDNIVKFLEDTSFMRVAFNNVVKILEEKKQTEAKDRLEAIRPDLDKMFGEYTECADYTYAVICHGDTWCNNLLFKYDDAERTNPTELRIIDWQLSRISYATTDLSNFLYNVADKAGLQDLDRYLQIYYDSFSSYLDAAGCDATNLYPYEKLQEHWNNYSKYGLFLAFSSLKAQTMTREEAAELTSYADVSSSKILKGEEKYKTRIVDLVLHCMERGII